MPTTSLEQITPSLIAPHVSLQKDFTDDCVFNEAMELHHYNTYSSAKHSNSRRILYLALNRHGQTRKIHIPITRSLGKLSTYTNALTHPVDETVTQSLLAKLFGSNHVRHGLKQLCESSKVHLRPLSAPTLIPRPKCMVGKKVGSAAPASLLSAKGGPSKGAKKKAGNAKKCRSGGDDNNGEVNSAGDCVRPTPMQTLVAAASRKRGPQKQQLIVKCGGGVGDDNCNTSPKKGPKRRPINAPGKSNSNSNQNGKRKKQMMGAGRMTTTVPTTTTEQQEDLDTVEEEGGTSELDDLALADDPTQYQHQFHINRLSSSLADDEEADFD